MKTYFTSDYKTLITLAIRDIYLKIKWEPHRYYMCCSYLKG